MENSDWIEWKGGDCPVDLNAEVATKLRDGEWFVTRAGRMDWRHLNDDSDIIAYRIVEGRHDD